MTPGRISHGLVREAPLLRPEGTVAEAVASILESGLPALPVVDADGRLVGIFGEREFMAALFPGYLEQLSYAAFVPSTLDDAIEKRGACGAEPVADHLNREHVDVESGFSDAQLAEIFMHHHVLIVPVLEGGRVEGVITRADFFRRLAERFLER